MDVYEDEVHFYQQTTVTREWHPKGHPKRLWSYPGRQKTAYFGFMIPKTGELFTYECPKSTWETTITAIRSFLAKLPEGMKVRIIMDNAPWHKKASRLIRSDPVYADIAARIEILPLPPYSPDLDPIEQIWPYPYSSAVWGVCTQAFYA